MNFSCRIVYYFIECLDLRGTDLMDKKKNTPIDRRIRKTRALLRQGLIQLMTTKDIQDISVKELSDLADINRGTFYLHYNDIFDMLEKTEDELFAEFNEILDRNLTAEILSPEHTLREIFAFLDRNRDFAKVTMGPHGDLAFVNRMKELVRKRIYAMPDLQKRQEDPIYIDSFIVSGCIGVIETWLNHPNPKPPEEMALICNDLLTKGLHFM